MKKNVKTLIESYKDNFEISSTKKISQEESNLKEDNPLDFNKLKTPTKTI